MVFFEVPAVKLYFFKANLMKSNAVNPYSVAYYLKFVTLKDLNILLFLLLYRRINRHISLNQR